MKNLELKSTITEVKRFTREAHDKFKLAEKIISKTENRSDYAT